MAQAKRFRYGRGMQWLRDGYVVDDDPARLDLDIVCTLLHTTYWAHDRPRAIIEMAVQNSTCLGLYHEGEQVGFCRAVTDHATFTWICDVIVAEAHRRHGLGKWLVECLIAHPRLQTHSQLLATRDAHTLYERYGFELQTDYLKRVLSYDDIHPMPRG